MDGGCVNEHQLQPTGQKCEEWKRRQDCVLLVRRLVSFCYSFIGQYIRRNFNCYEICSTFDWFVRLMRVKEGIHDMLYIRSDKSNSYVYYFLFFVFFLLDSIFNIYVCITLYRYTYFIANFITVYETLK